MADKLRIQTTRKRVFGVKQLYPGSIVEVPFKQGRLLVQLGKGWQEAPPEELGAERPPQSPPMPEPDALPARRGRPRKAADKVIEASDQNEGQENIGSDTVTGTAATETDGLQGDQPGSQEHPEGEANEAEADASDDQANTTASETEEKAADPATAAKTE